MARVLAKHGIEQFVIFWISKFRNDANIRSQRKFIEKAIKQISFFLNPPCCIDPEATIEFRRLDNDLTRFIAAQLANKLDKRKWRKSLERAKAALTQLLNGCCPECDVTITSEIIDVPPGQLDFIEVFFCSVKAQMDAQEVTGLTDLEVATELTERLNLFLDFEFNPVINISGVFTVNPDASITFTGAACLENCETNLEFVVNYIE